MLEWPRREKHLNEVFIPGLFGPGSFSYDMVSILLYLSIFVFVVFFVAFQIKMAPLIKVFRDVTANDLLPYW
jgi:hypothetical protein